MSTGVELTGMVISVFPAGDYDRRVVLLTKERGKITAFAHGARRPRSTLLAATSSFCFGTFTVFEGQTAYTLAGADIKNYFPGLHSDVEGACYGAYFCEFAGYYGRENLDASQMLNLLYVALRALENKKLPNRLVRYVYEIKLMEINGEYPMDAAVDPSLNVSARYTFEYILASPIQKLYTFTVTEEVLRQIARVQDRIRQKYTDTQFRSLEVLKAICG